MDMIAVCNIIFVCNSLYYSETLLKTFCKFISRRFEDIVLQYFGRLARTGQRTDIQDIGSYWYDDPVNKKNGEFDCVVKSSAGYEFYECKFYQNPMTEQECRDEEEQLKEIPCKSPAIIGFVCSSGFDFKSDRYSMITGEDLFS